MKKIILLMLIAFLTKAKAQITYEQTYDSASTYNFCSGNASQLVMVNFEVSGERYVKINKCGKNLKLYDLNHNLLKTINIANLPNDGAPNYQIGTFLYLSEKLFNSDNKMEYMYVMTSPTFSTMIYNEDGTLLFSEPGAPMVLMNVHQLQFPIYNTSQGTKMILSYSNGQAKVFGLTGTLTTAIQKNSGELLNSNYSSLSNPSPNPFSNQTIINYTLPQGVSEGEIVIFDIQSKEIKRFKVDNTFNNLIISGSEIASGTYYYQLQTNGQNSSTKKMVVIK
jgi:hypothetical protein